jgi:hypothetical protein
VAKHKSGVICQFHLTVPPLATTLRKMVSQSVRMGMLQTWEMDQLWAGVDISLRGKGQKGYNQLPCLYGSASMTRSFNY